MYPTWLELSLLGLIAALGAGSGWWACRRYRLAPAPQELGKARDALAQLNRLAELVVSDVRSHSRSIAHLTEELAFLNVEEAQMVAEVVRRLVETNQAMEERLVSAETTLQEQAQELEAKSTEACTDGLTRLANRRAFNDELARRFAEFERLQRPLSVILLDVDRFKDFNDQHGHQTGDELLRGVAAALRENARGMDLVARYGGEEFGIVLPNTPLVVATTVAERVREAIAAREFRYEGRTYCITVSTGVAELRSSEQVAIMLRRVDEALYTSKMHGRNCTHYHDGRQILSCAASSEPRHRDADGRRYSAGRPPRSAVEAASPAVGHASGNEAPAPQDCGGSSDEYIAGQEALRCLLRSRLAEWKRGGKPLTVAIVNLEDHDSLNTAYGAAVGERAMLTLGRQLFSAVREMDTVGRYGDTSFAVVLPRTSQPQATFVAERIRRYVADCAIPHNDTKISLRVSIGVTEVIDGDDVVRLLDRGHATMQAARQSGQNIPFVHKGNWPEPMTSLPVA